MISAMFEAITVPARRSLYVVLLVLVLVSVATVRPARIILSPADAPTSDFDYFHAGARAALEGQLDRAYDEPWFRAYQQQLYARDLHGPWSYPPPFGLVVAPFGLVDRGWALLLFMQLTLFAYLLTLRRLAGDWLSLLLLLMLVPMMGVILFGQNGLLTGTLAGLSCLGLADRRRWAGIPLGLMIIKPHLALGLGLYVLASRDWRTFWTAGATAAAAALAATLAFSASVWPAFLAAAAFAGEQLPTGYFPLFRMISAYAAARSMGTPHALALAVQLASALAAIALILVAQRQLPRRMAIGIAALATLMISPYAFDYDLMIAGVGMALLLPTLVALGRPAERSALYMLFIASATYGLVLEFQHPTAPRVSLAAIGMWLVIALVWRIVGRHPLGSGRAMAGSAGDQ
jgi:hypothetical protein